MIPLDQGAIAQDPDAVRKRTIDFGSAELLAQGLTGWLPEGVTLSSASWDADDTDIQEQSFDETTVTILVGGVTRTLDEGGHHLVCHFTTSEGEEDDAELV